MLIHSLKYLAVDVGFYLSFSMWSGLNFLTIQWLDSKAKCSEREKQRQAEVVLPSDLENHVASHSLHATD